MTKAVRSRAGEERLYRHPPSADDIERMGRQVLDELPEVLRRHVRDVVIAVVDFPDDATLRDLGLESPFDLLGLYHGVPVGHGSSLAPPREDVDKIYLYRRPLLDYWCETGEPLEAIVHNTLIHEMGHHFGFSDDDMEEIEFGER
jgi:predicted Zn-dependent protease with MMP-like domain